jgi:hypothetical protein
LTTGNWEVVFAAEYFKTVVVGLPAVVVVRQHGHAGDRAGVAIKETIVVGEHALRKIGVALALDFDVNVDPALLAAGEGDLHQRVGKASAKFGVAHHLP